MTLSNAVLGLVLAGTAFAAAAQSTSPAGAWKTIDDATKKEKSVVRIVDNGGVYNGRIEKLLESTMAPDAVCKECTDDRKDKPIVGMTLIKGVKQNETDKLLWDGGEILDPNNGKTYRTRLKPVDGGKKLEMRGYIGPFYRTQTWLRAQ